MKIAIPIDNTDNMKVNQAFARAPYFYLYIPGTKEEQIIDNQAASQSGGAGVKAAQLLVDNKVDILLAPRCGENAAEILKSGGVKLYKTEGHDVKGNLDGFAKGKLEELVELEAGHHK